MSKKPSRAKSAQSDMTPMIVVFDENASKSDFAAAKKLWKFSNEQALKKHNSYPLMTIHEVLKFVEPNGEWFRKQMYYIECPNETDARQAYIMIKLSDLKLVTAIRFKREDASALYGMYMGINRLQRMEYMLSEFTRTSKLFAKNTSMIASNYDLAGIEDMKKMINHDMQKYCSVINQFFTQARF